MSHLPPYSVSDTREQLTGARHQRRTRRDGCCHSDWRVEAAVRASWRREQRCDGLASYEDEQTQTSSRQPTTYQLVTME